MEVYKSDVSYLLFTDSLTINRKDHPLSGIIIIDTNTFNILNDTDNADYFEVDDDRFLQFNTIPIGEWDWNPNDNEEK